MQISQLRTFLAVHRTGSFAAAARQVHLSHSAVSVQMKQLEEEAGGALFRRDSRPVRLTDLGRQFVKHVRFILNEVDVLKNLSAEDSTEGRLTVGFVPTTLETLLPRVLSALRGSYPRLQVFVRSGLSSELVQALREGALDLAIVTAPAEPDAILTLREIVQETLFVIAPRHADCTLRPAALLRAHPYIAFSRRTLLGRQISAGLTESGIEADPMIELDSITAIEELVAGGFGVSVVPQRLFAPPLGDRLTCVPFGGPYPARRLVMLSRRDDRRATVRRRIAETVSEGEAGRKAGE